MPATPQRRFSHLDARSRGDLSPRFARSWRLLSSCEVKQREQEDPYDVDQVPVEAAVLERHMALLRNAIAPDQHRHGGQHSQANQNMHAVQTGHREVEAIEYLFTMRQRRKMR